jgi:hypothetical protein
VAVSHETIALILWLLLGLDLMLTIVGLGVRSWRLLAVAAAMSVVFGVLAIFSIGFVILTLAVVQGGAAGAFYRGRRATAQHK